MINSRFIGNGFSVTDRDGLRVNEGGDGDLIITVKHTVAANNGADGIEVDERGTGDVRVDMFGTELVGNGSLDPGDFDDGFDIDEYNDGSVLGTVTFTVASDNFEQGLDFNENNAGDIRVDLSHVEAIGNAEEGVEYEEDDDFAGGGDIVTTMTDMVTNGNGANDGDAGLKVREKGDGSVIAVISGAVASDNAIGGILVREDAAGNLRADIDARDRPRQRWARHRVRRERRRRPRGGAERLHGADQHRRGPARRSAGTRHRELRRVERHLRDHQRQRAAGAVTPITSPGRGQAP